MSAKTSKSLLSSRIVSLLKNEKRYLKNSELSVLESALKDDFVRHNWLYSLLNAALNNCAVISSEDLTCLGSSNHTMSSVDISAVESLNDEIAFYQQKIAVLNKQKEWLKKQVFRLKSDITEEKKIAKYSVFEVKVKQILLRLKHTNNDEFVFPKTNDVVDLIVTQLNENFQGLCDTEIDDMLNELSLVSQESDKQIFLTNLYGKYFEKLLSLNARLLEVQHKCKELLSFYNDVVRKELSWRKEMNSLMEELQRNVCSFQENNSRIDSTRSNDLLPILYKLEVPNHDLHDELNELLNRLKEKLSLL